MNDTYIITFDELYELKNERRWVESSRIVYSKADAIDFVAFLHDACIDTVRSIDVWKVADKVNYSVSTIVQMDD